MAFAAFQLFLDLDLETLFKVSFCSIISFDHEMGIVLFPHFPYPSRFGLCVLISCLMYCRKILFLLSTITTWLSSDKSLYLYI